MKWRNKKMRRICALNFAVKKIWQTIGFLFHSFFILRPESTGRTAATCSFRWMNSLR